MSGKYFWPREEGLKQHVKHFVAVHEPFWDSFIPTREEVILLFKLLF